jgi:hypothetical protein
MAEFVVAAQGTLWELPVAAILGATLKRGEDKPERPHRSAGRAAGGEVFKGQDGTGDSEGMRRQGAKRCGASSRQTATGSGRAASTAKA